MCHLPSFAEQECTLQAMRAATNIQLRKNLPPLTPEFKQVIHQDSQAPLPTHARLLSTPKRGYVASAKGGNDNQVTVGVHFSPEEFLSEAIRLCHPTEHNSLSLKEVRANIAHLSAKTVHQISNSLRTNRGSQKMDCFIKGIFYQGARPEVLNQPQNSRSAQR